MVVIPELEFRDVEREILMRHLVERADHPVLHQRPEPFDFLSVNGTDDILAARVDDCRVGIFTVQPATSDPFSRASYYAHPKSLRT